MSNQIQQRSKTQMEKIQGCIIFPGNPIVNPIPPRTFYQNVRNRVETITPVRRLYLYLERGLTLVIVIIIYSKAKINTMN